MRRRSSALRSAGLACHLLYRDSSFVHDRRERVRGLDRFHACDPRARHDQAEQSVDGVYWTRANNATLLGSSRVSTPPVRVSRLRTERSSSTREGAQQVTALMALTRCTPPPAATRHRPVPPPGRTVTSATAPTSRRATSEGARPSPSSGAARHSVVPNTSMPAPTRSDSQPPAPACAPARVPDTSVAWPQPPCTNPPANPYQSDGWASAGAALATPVKTMRAAAIRAISGDPTLFADGR